MPHDGVTHACTNPCHYPPLHDIGTSHLALVHGVLTHSYNITGFDPLVAVHVCVCGGGGDVCVWGEGYVYV